MSRFQPQARQRLRESNPCSGWLRPALVARLVLGCVVGVTFAITVAHACNVPVFRFALERWRSDAYRVTVIHRGPLTADERSMLEKLEQRQEDRSANVGIRVLDADRLDESADRELLESLGDAALPVFVVQYPEALQIPLPIWGARFTPPMVDRMLESPLRKQLLERLLAGDTAVWLVLESGDASKNDAAAALLDGELKKLATELKLPELTDLPDDTLFAKTPLKLAFSTLRVPRSEAEGPLVQMLLRSEADLLERDDPMIFPVFGRGRALLPLVGAGITAENIANSAKFLVGACSCEVKELNPGFDLLIAAPWERLLAIDGQPLPIVSTRKNAGNNAGDGAARGSSDGSPEGGLSSSTESGAKREPELVPIPAGNGVGELNRGATAMAVPAANEPPMPRLPIGKLAILGLGGVGLLVALVLRVVRSQQSASRCRES
ncbi:MAG: hypothetical protein ACKO38_20160 [Planctomycetota bacterium]